MRWTSWMSTLTASSRCWSSSTLDRCNGHSAVMKILNAFFLQQVEDENYTAELLYAADKYELDKLVIL